VNYCEFLHELLPNSWWLILRAGNFATFNCKRWTTLTNFDEHWATIDSVMQLSDMEKWYSNHVLWNLRRGPLQRCWIWISLTLRSATRSRAGCFYQMTQWSLMTMTLKTFDKTEHEDNLWLTVLMMQTTWFMCHSGHPMNKTCDADKMIDFVEHCCELTLRPTDDVLWCCWCHSTVGHWLLEDITGSILNPKPLQRLTK
jgi:hypothetical protein